MTWDNYSECRQKTSNQSNLRENNRLWGKAKMNYHKDNWSSYRENPTNWAEKEFEYVALKNSLKWKNI